MLVPNNLAPEHGVVHITFMTKASKLAPPTAAPAAPFTRRGVTVLPPAVPPKASVLRIRKAVKAAAAKHADLVAG